MRSKLDQSSDFIEEDLTSSICVIPSWNREMEKQPNGHENVRGNYIIV